jgi:hypothetical protein
MGEIPVLALRSPLDFTVTAFAEDDTALTMQFTERVYRRQDR